MALLLLTMYGLVGSYRILIKGVAIAVTIVVDSTSIVKDGTFIICTGIFQTDIR